MGIAEDLRMASERLMGVPLVRSRCRQAKVEVSRRKAGKPSACGLEVGQVSHYFSTRGDLMNVQPLDSYLGSLDCLLSYSPRVHRDRLRVRPGRHARVDLARDAYCQSDLLNLRQSHLQLLLARNTRTSPHRNMSEAHETPPHQTTSEVPLTGTSSFESRIIIGRLLT